MHTRADSAEYKLGMRSLAGAVNIITSLADGRPCGMTATAVCSAAAEPPTVLVCINQLTATHGAIAESGVFCVNVLRHEDKELSALFSGAGAGQLRGEARFRAEQWTRLATGAPVLEDALVSFDCRVVNRLMHGTHTIYLGEVQQLRIGRKGKPLLYSDGQYAKLASLAHGEPLPEGLDYWGE
jgi:flavin reductase